MPGTRLDQYRRWFEYEKDSHRKVMASFESVPMAQRNSAPFQKALDIMAHVIAARRMWLFRMGKTAERPLGISPTGVNFAELASQLESMQRDWETYLQQATEEQISESLEYQSLDAGWFHNSIEDILAQLFGHSSYHRGQIASLVKAAGGQPAVTDLIYWCREPVPKAGS
jgi:uncharacterized damage-inducible protein DinB